MNSSGGLATKTGYGEGQGITIALRRPDKIIGEMRPPPACFADGAVHPGALIGFACELSAAGAALHLPPGRSSGAGQIQATMLADCRSPLVSGESLLVHAGAGAMLWQTSLHDAQGVPVAVIAHSRILSGARQGEGPAASQEAAPIPKPAKSVKAERSEDGEALPTAEIRRRQIVDAACEVIARKGFANATIREIAAAAGLHVPTMYQYIDSKEALLELVYSYAIRQLHAGVDQASAGRRTARDRLHAIITLLLDNGDRYRRQVGVLNREFRSLPRESQQRVLREYGLLHEQLAAAVNAGIAAGEFRPVNPIIMAHVLETICDIWPLRQFAVRDIGLPAFKEEVMRLIDASLGSDRATAG
jgi:AcrR family transcriptional regulator